ncbi:hypothetical protein H6G17_16525 [Chroococcidiopsis sp. FACHB-1243]|uniref:hypothetical protein n=1 Tax=Chroococcidiopsis sp. [FACHB-1243] TaxID=2692781 RepID=UPI0017843E77|nr:hypothetical protein [Chroococcidiopsis sp. [FACHB-1243]]MBD2307108.1 hypothetical protein [Chroococcidiopsis sp. [FACHB-1243]]
MQAKQKVTLYLTPELHRRLKIRAAIDSEPMSELAARALAFYLSHQELIDEAESYGNTHRVYACPECATTVALNEGELVSLKDQPGVMEQSKPARVAAEATVQEGQLALASH